MPTTYVWTGTTSSAFATSTNFTPNGNPTTGDTVIFDQNAVNDCAGSDQSAITLAALYVYQGFTRSIGSTATALKIKATVVQIGLQTDPAANGAGPTRVVLDLSTAATTVTVFNTGNTTQDTGLENVRIKGVNTSNVINVINGSVGIGTNAASDVATFPTINVSGGRCNIGGGVTWTSGTCIASGGQLTIFSGGSSTALTLNGNANVTTYGDYLLATVTVNGGTFTCNHRASSGATITTLNRNGGTTDFSKNPQGLTVTTDNEAAGTIKMFSASQVTTTTAVKTLGNSTTRTVSQS